MDMATIPCPPLFQVSARYLTFIYSPLIFLMLLSVLFFQTLIFIQSLYLLIISELFTFWPVSSLPLPPSSVLMSSIL